MNTTIHKTIRSAGIALATLLLVVVSFAVAPKAQATELGGWDDIGYYDMSSPSYDGGGWDDVGYYDMSSPSYDTGFTDYYTDSYSSGRGFTGGSTLGGGGWSMPRSTMGGGGGYSYSTVYAPTNTNTCTSVNSCNSYVDDHSIFNAPTNIVTNPAPVVINNAPSTPAPVYQPTYYPTYQPTYYPAQQQRPIAYNNTPYVTLAAVPYTGLELGPVGTALYWGFLVLWCLFAAYLIVVKKVHNKIAAWFTGSATQNSAVQKSSDLPSSGALRATPAGQTFVRQNSAPLLAGIDPFIQAQINRAK